MSHATQKLVKISDGGSVNMVRHRIMHNSGKARIKIAIVIYTTINSEIRHRRRIVGHSMKRVFSDKGIRVYEEESGVEYG